ncbi:hypothetical protein FWC31_02490 [Candidatus Saccharibacteria bacterium]|nr:hypothetical protein [Candidatus Saccharibacteria bacterium]
MAETKSSETPKQIVAGKPVIIEKSLSGLDGWLVFHMVAIGANIISYTWAFFLAIIALISGVEGISLGVAIETLMFSLILVGLCGLTLLLIANRRKLALPLIYVTLGVSALFATVVSFTTMFTSYESCSTTYDCTSYYSYGCGLSSCKTISLPAQEIILLIGLVVVTWIGTLLIAYYFKKSQRVKQTLVK